MTLRGGKKHILLLYSCDLLLNISHMSNVLLEFLKLSKIFENMGCPLITFPHTALSIPYNLFTY